MIERHIGPVIRRIRIERGMTQVKLAQRAGIVQSHISALESCSKPPTLQTLERVCLAMNVKISHVIIEAESIAETPGEELPNG
ncbi:MAG: helix-turn-helix domain-containing protein [Armatimonadaceae bacterium]